MFLASVVEVPQRLLECKDGTSLGRAASLDGVELRKNQTICTGAGSRGHDYLDRSFVLGGAEDSRVNAIFVVVHLDLTS